MRLVVLGLAGLLAATGVKSCATVEGPKTQECPDGKYSVFVDKSTDPPTYSQTCKDPAVPSPEPSPSAAPPSPQPSPSASPSSPPSPSPEPSPTPSAVPSATPPPPGEWTPGTIPPEGVCPSNYPVRPDYVTLGDKPYNPRPGAGNNMLYNFNVVPRMSDPKYCAHKGGGGGCEQWLPCAARWDPFFTPGGRPAIRVWGPSFNGDDVVRGSREAYAWEAPCPRDDPSTPEDEGNKRCYTNYYSVRMVIGNDGSPGGRYEMCVAPSEAEIRRSPNGCRFYDLRSQ